MKTVRKVAIIFFVLIGCVGCDQMTKSIARHRLADVGMISFLGDALRLEYTENTGGFLSLGATIPGQLRSWIFICIVGGILLVLLLYLLSARRINRPTILALSLVLAGGLSNLLDRIFHDGRVVDFMNVGVGSLRTGIFNVADVAITIGIAWLVWLEIINRPRAANSKSG